MRETYIKNKFNPLVSLRKIDNKTNELPTKAMSEAEIEKSAKRLAAKYYNAKTISDKNADLKTLGNKLIQVKSGKVDIITATPIGIIRNWFFDILVVILFSKNGDILKAIEITTKNAKNILKWDNYQKGYILITSKDLLQNENAIDITINLQRLINKHSQIAKNFDQIEISFKLLKTDKNNNKYHVYPANEELFKKEAYRKGGIIVGIIHHNGHIEYIERQVSKIWDSSVYWNIYSMPTEYKDLKHLSFANNLIVYACPININLKSNKQWLREIASKNRVKK